ncbi:MAG: SH3 domain-containing protein [Oscillospiraceae bacterium]
MALVLVMMTMLFTGCKKEAPVPETESSLNLNLPENSAPEASETTPATTEAPVINENTGTVTSVLNIRSSPSTEATVVGTLYAGDKIEVSRREVVTGIDWAYIIAPESGWVVMEFIEMDIPSQQPAQPDTSTPAGSNTPEESQPVNTTNIKAVVNANGLNIRSEASTSGKVQGAYNKGDVVTILETKGEWGRTNKGWIKLEFANTNSTSISGNNTTTTNNTTNSGITGNGSNTVILKGIVKVTDLNIRSEGNTNGTRLGSLTYGDRVEIYEKSDNWGRTKDGWVCLDYIYQDGTTGTKTASGKITANGLNIRSGPGKGYASVGSYNAGDSVTILEQFTYNGTTWGCTNQGWISMDYVTVGTAGNTTTTTAQTGTVIGNGLNVRNGAGTDYPTIGSHNYGDRVTILEQKKVGDTTWGRTSQGWISLDFVSLD